jgi:hypothetical protein
MPRPFDPRTTARRSRLVAITVGGSVYGIGAARGAVCSIAPTRPAPVPARHMRRIPR